jgi:hypothetical protein
VASRWRKGDKALAGTEERSESKRIEDRSEPPKRFIKLIIESKVTG